MLVQMSSVLEGHLHRAESRFYPIIESSFGKCGYLVQVEVTTSHNAASEQRQHTVWQQVAGMSLALVGGILYGLYSTGWNVACNDTFHVAKQGKLTAIDPLMIASILLPAFVAPPAPIKLSLGLLLHTHTYTVIRNDYCDLSCQLVPCCT